MIAAPTDPSWRADPSRTPLERLLAAMAAGQSAPGRHRPVRPWTLDARGTVIELRLSPSRAALDDATNRELLMACGAVIENLAIAANMEGRLFRVDALPASDGAMVARLSLDARISPRREEEALHRVIEGAGRPAVPSDGGVLSPALLALLRHGARTAGGRLDVVADDTRRELLAELQVEAARLAEARRDASRTASESAGSAAGSEASLTAGEWPRLDELLLPLGARFAVRSDRQAEHASHVRAATMDAPLLAVLGARGDAPGDWLSAGRALQRVLLHATSQRLCATLLNGAVRETSGRDALASIIPPGWTPQAIVRLDVDAGLAHRASCNAATAH